MIKINEEQLVKEELKKSNTFNEIGKIVIKPREEEIKDKMSLARKSKSN